MPLGPLYAASLGRGVQHPPLGPVVVSWVDGGRHREPRDRRQGPPREQVALCGGRRGRAWAVFVVSKAGIGGVYVLSMTRLF